MIEECNNLEELENVKIHSDDDDGRLKIIEEVPKCRRGGLYMEISADEAEMLTDIGKDLELNLEEKAAKTNLKDATVKRIIKQVITNEHVLAYVRQTENPDENVTLEFEPKLTRAKAKELFSSQQPTWVSPKSAKLSKTQVLISGDLPEDESSGDEYFPVDVEEESDDDADSTVQSETDASINEPSTPQSTECGTQTTWTEDGVFKIPEAKSETRNEKPNIALRTRSKLCLSDTPLEVIEEAFIPPDITTDMYDMDCDDDDWKNFLKEFTRPLNEITIGHEDEDHDPEYNILADEQMDKVDKEELRADRAVKVTRKELNDLIAELFDCTDDYNNGMGPMNPTVSKPAEQGEQQVVQENAEVADVEIVVLEEDFIMISEEQKLLLSQQMRQYVQIIMQHFLLTHNHPEYHGMSESYYNTLMDLQEKSNGNMFSYYCPLNLPFAIELADDWKEKFKREDDKDVENHNRHVNKIIYETIEAQAAGTFYIPTFSNLFLEVVSRSVVFIYPSLLPRIAFKPSRVLKKNFFMKSELELLALGLEQFIPFLKMDPFHVRKDGTVKRKDICHYIHKYMMPCKDPPKLIYQIKICKNSTDRNPVKYFFDHNEAPKLVHYVHPLDVFQVVPPCEREYESLPELWKNYIYPNYKPNIMTSTMSTVPMTSTMSTLPIISAMGTVPIANAMGTIPLANAMGTVPLVNRMDRTMGIPIAPKPPTMITLSPFPLYAIKKVNKPPVFNKNFTKKKKLPPKSVKSKEKRPKLSDKPNDAIPTNSGALHATSTPITTCRKSLESYFVATPETVSIPDRPLSIQFNSSIFKTLHSGKEDMFPNMPNLSTPVKKNVPEILDCSSTSNVNADDKESNTSNVENNEQISLNVEINADPTQSVESNETMLNVDDNAEKSQNVDNNTESSQNVEEVEQEKDNLDDINALMVASSTITSSVKKRLTCAEKKKAKQRREFKSNLRMLSEETGEAISEKADRFVQAYFDKIKEQLEIDEYHKIMEVLTNFDKNNDDSAHLYKSVEDIIGQKHPDILDEFLCFFTGLQAKNMGKLMPYLIINKMEQFLRKLELFFNDQPSQVKKIYRCLSELTMTHGVTMTSVKNTILPLLKGNSLLGDLFLQIFPKEKPPDSLFNNGPWEHVEVGKDRSLNPEDCYESITIPEAEDPYGGPNCICACHSAEDTVYKSRSMHCVSCGTKFMQGKVFVQTAKGLRIAKITFEDNSVDHITRLSCPIKMKRAESSPTKQISPTQEEGKLSSDEEPDKKQQRLMKAVKKRKPKKKPPPVIVETKPASPKPVVDAVIPPVERVEEVTVKKDCSDQNNENTSDSSMNEVKQATEENIEWDCNTSIESIELKLSPEHVSAESESEFCEETSQDNTDSDASGGESESNSPETSCQWNRSEDKIILETFQKVEDKNVAFKSIAERLEHRTLPQIQQRFEMLINLWKKLSKNS